MNSYINLIIELEGARARMQKWVQSVPEIRVDSCPFAVPNEGGTGRTRPLTQSGAARLDSIIWVVSCLVVILGAIKAAHSEQPLFWLGVWPFPAAVACTIFIFVRQGFHFESGVLVLGRAEQFQKPASSGR